MVSPGYLQSVVFLPRVLHKRLLLSSLPVQALVRINDLDDAGRIGVLCRWVLNIWPEAEIVVCAGL